MRLIRSLSKIWCVILFAAPVSWAYADVTNPGNIESEFEFKIPSDFESDETGDRKSKLESGVMEFVRQGDKYMKLRKFKAAYIYYEKAIKLIDDAKIGNSAYLTETIKRIQVRSDKAKKAWARDLFEQAKNQYMHAILGKDPEKSKEQSQSDKIATIKKQLQSAKVTAGKTLGIYYCGSETADMKMIQKKSQKNPAYQKEVQEFIKDCDKMIDAYELKEASSLDSVDPDYERRQDEIKHNLRQAEIYYKTGQYEKLRDTVEKVLVADQYNQKAINLLTKAYKKLYQIGAARASNDAIERIAEVEWKWNEQIPLEKNSIVLTPQKLSGKKAILYDKLQNIIIDKIDFKGISVESALGHLSKISGVMIQPPNNASLKENKINYLHLEKLPLLDVIRYVCDLTNLKYRIEEDTVFVDRIKTDGMEFASFDISRNLADMISREGIAVKEEKKDTSTEKISDAETFSDKTLGENKKDKETQQMKPPTQEQLKGYFGEALFPEGSKIGYDSKSGKLLVTNTPMNLRKLEFLLKELDCDSVLVLIDSKIMEVSMNDLEELGFDWLLTFNPQESSQQVYFNGKPTNLTAPQTVINTQNFMGASNTGNELVNNLSLIPNLGGSKFFDLSVSITAVDQMAKSEVLSTPRLLVKTGEKGELKIDQERYFPDDWSEGSVEIINGNAYTYNAPTPEFGDATALGTQFSVLPRVSSNRYTITLQLTTAVTQFTGWSDYDYSIVIGGLMNSPAGKDTKNPKMKMPEFSKRKVENTVKLYDGETVVIGGIMKDETTRVENKWPLLGDVPLIGRLFSNYRYETEKTNLMIFVTARLMNANGSPVHDARKQGLFEFGDR